MEEEDYRNGMEKGKAVAVYIKVVHKPLSPSHDAEAIKPKRGKYV